MKRPRPYIPLVTRCAIVLHQLGWKPGQIEAKIFSEDRRCGGIGYKRLLEMLLKELGFTKPQLDHDPALILRKFNPRTGRYTPDANDPMYLVYREHDDHLQKTTGRKPGAEKTVTTKGSDIWLKSKFNRLEGRTKKRPKAKIAQRKNPWPKGRKFR